LINKEDAMTNSWPTTNNATKTTYVMLALALIGAADAFYDSYSIYTSQLLWCPPPIDGCNIVASSPYARILGVPLGYVGLAYYVVMFGFAAWLSLKPSSRWLSMGAMLYTALGVCASIYFFYVQRTFIHAFCIYCLVSGVLTIGLFVTALRHLYATRAAGTGHSLHQAATLVN
jgi:uncharacterized membrane protein